MRITVLIVGIVLTLLSCCALGIATSLPIINSPRTTWSEAMPGIIPASLCSALSLVIAVVGLVLVLTAPKAETAPKRHSNDEGAAPGDDEE